MQPRMIHNQTQSVLNLLGLVLVVLTISQGWIQHGHNSKDILTQQDKVILYFTPTAATLPPTATFNLMIDPISHGVVFARVEMSFDPSMIHLTAEIQTTNSPLTTLVGKTSLSVANSTGRIAIALALSPGDSTPTTTFEFARLSFSAVTNAANQVTNLTILDQGVQIVDTQINALPFTSQPAALVLNKSNYLVYVPVAIKDNVPSPPILSDTETPTPTDTPTVTSTPTRTPIPPVNLVIDGSFEAGTPSTAWNEYPTGSASPICSLSRCGRSGAHTGSFWAWFGIGGATSGAQLTQNVVIPAGTATLSFWLKIPQASGTSNDVFDVYFDDFRVFQATGADAGGYGSYTKVTLDVSQYADSGSHILELLSYTNNGPTYFFVDDVVLEVH